MRGNNGNANDNKEVVLKLIQARLEKAKLMGYPTYAAYALDDRMAKTADNVYQLLDEVWKPAVAVKLRKNWPTLMPKSRKREETSKPKLGIGATMRTKPNSRSSVSTKMRCVISRTGQSTYEGVFYVANKLYGITFTPIKKHSAASSNALAFECKDKDGSHLGVLYMDHFPRAGKNGGAWCGTYRSMTYKDGKKVAPVVTIVTNFTPRLRTACIAERGRSYDALP